MAPPHPHRHCVSGVWTECADDCETEDIIDTFSAQDPPPQPEKEPDAHTYVYSFSLTPQPYQPPYYSSPQIYQLGKLYKPAQELAWELE